MEIKQNVLNLETYQAFLQNYFRTKRMTTTANMSSRSVVETTATNHHHLHLNRTLRRSTAGTNTWTPSSSSSTQLWTRWTTTSRGCRAALVRSKKMWPNWKSQEESSAAVATNGFIPVGGRWRSCPRGQLFSSCSGPLWCTGCWMRCNENDEI